MPPSPPPDPTPDGPGDHGAGGHGAGGHGAGGHGAGGGLVVLPLLAAGLVLLGGAVRLGCLGVDGLTAGEAALPWCYSDIVTIAQSRGLGPGVVPYVDVMTEYPPLTALQWWVGGRLGGGIAGFLMVTTAIQSAAAGLAVRLVGRTALPRRRLLLVAAAPALVATGTLNWDLVPMALLAAGVVAASRRRDAAAGVWLGLGTVAKVFPAVAVVALAAVRWHQGRRRDAGVVAGVAVLVVGVVQVPVALWASSGWDAWIVLNRQRPVDWDTAWYGLQVLLGRGLPTGQANAMVAAAVLGGWAVVLWLGLRPRRGRLAADRVTGRGAGWDGAAVASLALALTGWLLLAGKVYSPQHTLWLLPLLALSRVPVALGWALLVADLVVVAVRFPFLAGQQGLTPSASYGAFATAVSARWVVLLAVVSVAVAGAVRASARPVPTRAGSASG